MTRRASLRFNSLEDVKRFVDSLGDRAWRTTGRWTCGQILYHLAGAFEGSAVPPPAGDGPVAPRRKRLNPARFFVLRGWIPRGVPIPKPVRDALTPPDHCDQGVERLRLLLAIERFDACGPDLPPHPVVGPLTRDEWRRFHLRHCELHLGHVVVEAG